MSHLARNRTLLVLLVALLQLSLLPQRVRAGCVMRSGLQACCCSIDAAAASPPRDTAQQAAQQSCCDTGNDETEANAIDHGGADGPSLAKDPCSCGAGAGAPPPAALPGGGNQLGKHERAGGEDDEGAGAGDGAGQHPLPDAPPRPRPPDDRAGRALCTAAAARANGPPLFLLHRALLL